MSLASALFLAAVATQSATAEKPQQPDRGAQVETAQISATIMHPAVIENGMLVSSRAAGAPHSQIVHGDRRVTYEFE